MDLSIRKMDLEERRGIAYRHMCEQIEEELRAEYEAEFGEAFRQQYPFKPNSLVIHELALKRLSQK